MQYGMGHLYGVALQNHPLKYLEPLAADKPAASPTTALCREDAGFPRAAERDHAASWAILADVLAPRHPANLNRTK